MERKSNDRGPAFWLAPSENGVAVDTTGATVRLLGRMVDIQFSPEELNANSGAGFVSRERVEGHIQKAPGDPFVDGEMTFAYFFGDLDLLGPSTAEKKTVAVEGAWTYLPTVSDFSEPGNWVVEAEVTFPTGKLTYPARGFWPVVVGSDLG